jgi:ribose/xylose/arabinose/galactoside ABC-type transport system permease subunit
MTRINHAEASPVKAGGASPAPGWAASLGVLNPFSGPRRQPSTDRAGRVSTFDRFLDLGIYIALLALVVYFWQASPYFLTERNLLNIGDAVAVTGVLAAGMTVALIAGQLDLTVGSNIALVSVVIAVAIGSWNVGTPLAVLAGLAVGAVIGIVNTVLVVRAHINSIIATLAMSLVIQAIALIITDGQPKPVLNPALQTFMNDQVLGIPWPVIILVLVYLVGWVVLTFTRAGWHIYGVGGNASAALRSGIKVNRVYLSVFVITGVLAALGGVITTGTSGGGAGNYGVGAEFTVLAAVLLGGIGLGGGSGRIQRTLAGVLLIGVINDGLTLLSVNSYYQQLAQGAIFVLAVVLGAVAERRRAR